MALMFEEGTTTNQETDYEKLANRLAVSVERMFSSGSALALVQKASQRFASSVVVEILPFREGQTAYREITVHDEPESGFSPGFYATIVGVSEQSAQWGDYQYGLDCLRRSCTAAIEHIRSGDKWRMRHPQMWKYGTVKPIVIEMRPQGGTIQG